MPEEEKITKKTIAIFGAGFGGLAASRELGKKFILEPQLQESYRVLLIDQNPDHIYSPALCRVAASINAPFAQKIALEKSATIPVTETLQGLPVEFLHSTVTKIDLQAEKLLTENLGEIPWHYLIIACGAEINFHSISGLKERSLSPKTLDGAIKIRSAIESALEESTAKPIRVVIGGGGLTGVEFAAELMSRIRHIEKRRKKRGICRVTLCEARSEILMNIQPKIMETVRERLEKLGVAIRTDAQIKRTRGSVQKAGSLLPSDPTVELDTGEQIPFDVLVWAGGAKVSSHIARLGAKQADNSKLSVTNTMSCVLPDKYRGLKDRVFAIGDATCFIGDHPSSEKRALSTAETAIEQAKIAATNIIASIQQRPLQEYRPRFHRVTILGGGKWAVAQTDRITMSGFWGWMLKLLIELYYLRAILPKKLAFKTWREMFNLLRPHSRQQHLLLTLL